MNHSILVVHQLLAGLSDTLTGALLVIAPAFTLALMQLQAPVDSMIYISFIGAFVMSVGMACFYGAFLTCRGGCLLRLEVVWLLTALTRASVAVFVLVQVLAGTLGAGWLMVAAADGACVLIQAIGLRQGWLVSAAR